MPDLTDSDFQNLVNGDALNCEIEATLGRDMTEAERTVVNRARVALRLKRAQKRGEQRLDSAGRNQALRGKHNQVPRRQCADPERRARLEADDEAWLKWYCHNTFTRPFERPHVEIIAGCRKTHETNGRFVVAAERGIGKSVVLWGCVLKLKLTGEQPFPICVPWAAPALKRAFKFWKNAVAHNERLAEDYPEYCDPFRFAKGIPQRVSTTTWQDTGEGTGAQLTIGEGIIVFPDGLGCIGGGTINGNIRGLNHPQQDGSVLRPSIALVDDIQDRTVAKSPVMVADTIAIIDGDVAGCGDAGRDMPMLMACNCIGPHDVSEHYLSDPEWRALRVPCVERWPDGWEDPKSRVHELWAEWHRRFLDKRGDRTYYRKNKAGMTRGMRLSAPAAFAGAEKCPDALYGVIRMYHRMGHEAFSAERQQRPVDPVAEAGPYTFTPAIVVSRATKRQPLERPDWVTHVIASTDVNPSYALSTVLLGFGQDQSCAVLWYGLHRMAIPGDTSAPELARQLYAALTVHGRALAGLSVRPDHWAIDAGGAQFDPVIRFAGESARVCGIPATGFTGRGAKNYKPYGKTLVAGQKREECHGAFDIKNGRQIRWVPWNADYWREIMQRAWLGDVGAPGACSLFHGTHGEFAAQVAGERLLGKAEVGGQMFWNWHTVPGRHDFGDCMAQGYAAAAFGGIGTGGMSAPRRYVETRRCKVQREM